MAGLRSASDGQHLCFSLCWLLAHQARQKATVEHVKSGETSFFLEENEPSFLDETR